MESKKAFVQKLQQLAKEQQSLAEHGLLPDWLGPINSAIARNALPFIIVVSLFISIVLFCVFFSFFYALEGRII